MKEKNDHIIYEMLENKYKDLEIDYVVISTNEYNGLETHKNAVIKAIEIIGNRFECNYKINSNKMEAKLTTIDELLQLPDSNYDNKKTKTNRAFTPPKPITYWYAFLEPPYKNQYLTEDFIEFNNNLFKDKKNLEIYRWNDEFSDYFDAGLEWWGTALWSIYDKTNNYFIIIAASTTD